MSNSNRTYDTDFYFKLSTELKRRMEGAAGRYGISASEFVRRAILAGVKREARR